jgi:ABC-type multidrug transport system permease subunit
MRKVWIIAWNDLQMTLQSKQHWFLLLALPALIIYLVGLGAQGIAHAVPTSIRIDVLDQDDSAASNAVVAALAEANETLLICPAYNDPADPCALAEASLSSALAQQRLADEVTFASLTIPEGFATALETGGEVSLVFQPGAGLAAPEIAFGAVQNVVTRMGGPIVAARLSTQLAESLGIETGPEFYAARLADATASWGPVLSVVACTERSRSEGPPPPVQVMAEFTRSNEGQMMGAQLLENGFKLSTPSMAAMFVMISILGMTQSLAEERLMGVLRRVGTMPVSKVQLLGGKLLATYLMGLLQFGILLAFGEALGVDFGSAPLATILAAMAYVLAVTAMALALAALVRTPNQASAMATFAWVVLVPLGGGWWPLTFVPAWMQTLGHLSPVAWCLDALNALVFYQGTLADVLRPVGVLLLFAATFFVFGVRKLDYQQSRGSDVTKVLPYFGIRSDKEA